MIRLSNAPGHDSIMLSINGSSVIVTKRELETICEMSKSFFTIRWPDDDCDEVFDTPNRSDLEDLIADDKRERAADMMKELSQ